MSFGGYALFPLPLNIQMPQRAQLPYSLYSLSGPLAVKQPAQEAHRFIYPGQTCPQNARIMSVQSVLDIFTGLPHGHLKLSMHVF